MANPVITACPADTWTKVATNVYRGQVHLISFSPNKYLHTYRDTGEAAPSASTEGVPVSDSSLPIIADSTEPIDVYIYAIGVAGSVRVDL